MMYFKEWRDMEKRVQRLEEKQKAYTWTHYEADWFTRIISIAAIVISLIVLTAQLMK